MNKKEKGKVQMIAGAIGAVLAGIGFVFSRTLTGGKKRLVIVLSSALLVGSVYTFFTGYNNYAVVMMGHNTLPAGKYLGLKKNEYTDMRTVVQQNKIPMITVKDKEELKKVMEAKGRLVLWLPCAKGGKWYRPSAFLYTRWNLPDTDVTCPTGRKAIDYQDG